MATHRALVLSTVGEAPSVQMVPKPQVTPGSAVIRVVVANVLPYARAAYMGDRDAPIPTPLVIGSTAIGRIESVGSDATVLQPGDLVFVDCFVRGRDDPSTSFLFGFREGPTAASKKLSHGEWRDSTYAEFAKVPLENCYKINEDRLLGKVENGGLGHKIDDFAFAASHVVPYGGLRDIGLQPGDTIVVAPATGTFGGAAVSVAVAMGARVIAAGRNVEALKKLAANHERVEIVGLKDDMKANVKTLQSFGQIDAYLDFSPPAAAKSNHIESCLMAVKPYGRVSLMGGIRESVSIPYMLIMFNSLQLRGRFMYEREDVRQILKLYERGLLKVGPAAGYKTTGKYGIDDWDKAFEAAEKTAGWGSQVLMAP